MKHAAPKDLQQIYRYFAARTDWFPHVRKDYLSRMLDSRNVVFDCGVIITYNFYQRRNTIGPGCEAQPRDVIIHQILNTRLGDGKGWATKVMMRFLKFVDAPVWLTVRSDNARACSFYERVGFLRVGNTSWSNGTIPGYIYLSRKQNA